MRSQKCLPFLGNIKLGEFESKICLRCTAYKNTTTPLKVKIYRKTVIEASVYLLAA